MTFQKIKSIAPSLLVAIIACIFVFGAFFYALFGIIEYWQLVAACTTCIKTFSTNFFQQQHLFLLSLITWSFIGFIRAGQFLRKEHLFHKNSKIKSYSMGQVHLLDSIPMAAWSSGFLYQIICVHKDFWNKLTKYEKQALIAHESFHIEQNHSLQFLGIGLAKSLINIPGFALTMNKFHQKLRLKSEIEADKKAIDKTSKRVVASLLHKALSFESDSQSSTAPTLDAMIIKRVEQLITSSKTQEMHTISIYSELFSVLGVFSFFLCSLSFLTFSISTVVICLE